MKRLLGLATLCICLSAAIPAVAGNIIVGNPPDPGTGNGYPFGEAYQGEYQQVYNANQFTGTITITGLQFFNTQFNDFATQMNSGNWTISLSTTSANWNTLSPTMANNIGGNNTQVFSGNLVQPWTFGDTLNITLTTPFTYNPADGNLLMDIVATGTTDNGGLIFFDTNGFNNGGFDGNTFLGRVYCPGGTDCGGVGSVNSGYGLVTGFVTSGGTTPEPSSLLLLGTGLAAVAGVVRRKLHS